MTVEPDQSLPQAAETEENEYSKPAPETVASIKDKEATEAKKPEHEDDGIRPLSENRKQDI